MGFHFQHLCDLLLSLERNRILKAATESRATDPDARVVSRWFTQHGKRLRCADTDQLAVLSCLFPEKRPDRVYMLQDNSLSRVIGRCLLLGSSRREELDRWRVSGGADLGQCVENVMQQAENHLLPGQEVTVEEIDGVLTLIASRSRFSGPKVRRQRAAVDVEEALSPIYRRLSSRDAKWLTRMILKSYYPVAVPERVALRSFHFLLPRLLLFQDSFEAALKMLTTEPLVCFPAHPDPGQARDLGAIALRHLYPVTGVKIGRPDYWKARSIKHCCRMIGGRRMSIEKKYDGEYCQIHIDVLGQNHSIRIFSKSGKESTEDRSGINEVLKESLRLKSPGCKFSRRCILEGELVVWSDEHRKIMDFHKLRKFISRSGTFIGTEDDSQPHPDEHLMIIFFDVLLLDDDACLRKPHRERRLLLKDLVKVINGRADIAEQRVLDFSQHGSQSRLEALLAKGIAERWEGFVLKSCEDPYFTFFSGDASGSCGRWIKLKKDYIPGLGDTVDLTIIGGSYNSRDAVALKERHKKILWTHFFVGCLLNKDSVLQFNVKPRFRVIDVIDRNGISPQNMRILNQIGEFSACETESDLGFDIELGHDSLPRMNTVYKKPFVVEMLGGGFEKPSGARYFTLRFPRILKIHSDRSFEEAASFAELQLLADDARAIPSEELRQEEHEWSKRLKLGDGSYKYIVDRSQSVLTTTTSSSQTASCVASDETTMTVCNLRQSGGASSWVTQQEQHEVHRPVTTHIPICIDTSMSSSPPLDVSNSAGNYLTSNDNLSSNPSSRQRKTSTSTSTSDMDPKLTTPAIQQTNDRENVPSSNMSSKPTSSQQVGEPNTAEHHQTKSISNTQTPKNHIPKSPLPTIPIYFNDTPCRDEEDLILANTLPTTSSLDAFLTALQSQPQSHPSRSPLGLILLNTHKTPLGPLLLTFSKSLHHHLHTQPTTTSTQSPQSGKIIVLDAAFLNIPATAEDTRFGLTQTWENIGREYFYAAVTWNRETPARYSRDLAFRVKEKGEQVSDEIPCTPSFINGARGVQTQMQCWSEYTWSKR
ncbi:hypothetical protein P170DRAFT_506954 [Aspergillus steynii IBT 23096]|uniref:ATP-dependent DNA ligase family profile domain-containing protein n=1 Tax=Aspergillus steynii IBT 23096 TaxID=1392250 RepID=A0A2I2GGQ4_9EURO|nr:uncharacterized protein P170DRAFT_506954 [Aspergillus steynii IBT 23096]PLB52065.1 hypothetical protein P170DRAFT_506954 [Aspergillus steynii IBT 23096]